MARDLDRASSQYLAINSNLGITAAPFTWAGWCRPELDGQSLVMVGMADIDDANVGLNIMVRGNVATDPIQGYNSVGTWGTSTGVTFGTWHHFAIVCRTSTDRSVYIDGGSQGDNSASWTPTNWDNLRIGVTADSTPANYFDGAIEYPAVWNTDLTGGQIVALAALTHPATVQVANLRACWPLVSDDKDIINGYDLTPVNSPTFVEGVAMPSLGPSIGAWCDGAWEPNAFAIGAWR